MRPTGPAVTDRSGAERSEPSGDSTLPLTASLRASALNCETLAEAEPRALGLTYEFDAAAEGDPYSVTIAFDGRRPGVNGRSDPADRFQASTTVERVLPGSGRIAVTTRIPGLTAGVWNVTARPSVHRIRASDISAGGAAAVLMRLPAGSAAGSTGWAPLINQQAPGVVLGSWAALVALGAVVGVVVQALLATRLGLPVASVLLVSLVACLVGLIGAKAYYLIAYPANRRQALTGGGMCIQGFVLAATATMAIGAWLSGVGVGLLLDLTAAGLMFGMTIGRFGCFFSGCCVGRPTASRWGVWSSDRRLGLRRIPTQLLESAMAATIGVAAAIVLVTVGPPRLPGAIFIAAVAAYVLARQLLLPLRAEPRKTTHGRLVTMAMTTVVLVADLLTTAIA